MTTEGVFLNMSPVTDVPSLIVTSKSGSWSLTITTPSGVSSSSMQLQGSANVQTIRHSMRPIRYIMSLFIIGVSEFPCAYVAVWFLACLIVVVLVILFAVPEVLCRAQGGVHLMSLVTQ